MGAGDLEGEFAALGVDFHCRGALLDEALGALRAGLDGEFSSHEGPTWRYEEVGLSPPRAAPGADLGRRGVGRARRRAARWGDGWLAVGPPEVGLSAAVAEVHELRERYGRADEPFTVGAMSGPLYVGEPRWTGGRSTVSPEQIASFLRSIAGLGVDQIQVSFRSRDVHELYDQLRAFGAEVAPLVAAGARRPVRSG